jgi:copper chaperone NosL
MNRWILRACLVGLLVSGCDSGPIGPKEPVWGKQPCEHCAMLLSDKDHGAQLATGDGERLFFDDLGCMVAWTFEHPGSAAQEWVRTADTRQWLPAGSAGFRRSEHTPMGFGFIAVSEPGPIDWPEVKASVQQTLRSR